MYKKLAGVLSIAFFPGLIPTYLVGVIYFTAPYVLSFSQVAINQRLSILAFVLTYTFVFPGLLILWLKRKGRISSIFLKLRKDRLLPYLFSVILSYFLAYLFLTRSPELIPTGVVLICIASVILIIALINLVWQISAHSAGMGGLTGSFLTLGLIYDDSLLKVFFFIALFLSGLVMSSRLYLGAHTPSETYTGFFVGLVVSIVSCFFV